MKLPSLILSAFLALAAFAQPAAAQNKVHDVDITVTLATDGSAQVREVWDMTLSKGTEVYLGRENLGDISIRDLTVSDEQGETYQTDRSWDVDRSFERKKGHCGLHSISDGYEICWGIGEYGHRTYTVEYTLTNLVKSLEDYDMIHYMFYTPNDFRGEHVKVTIEKPGFEMDTLTRIWAFGYDGYIWREDGKVIAESENLLEPSHDIILLMLVARIIQRRKDRKNAFGTLDLSSIDWSREIPYAGDILKNYYVISTSKDIKAKNNSVASAMILHMLQEGCLEAQRDLATGKVNIYFKENADFTKLDSTERGLWSMMLEASGDNRILEEKEFSSWASKHETRLYNWTQSIKATGLGKLRTGGYYQSSKYTDAGRAENRKVIGFKKFLEDTTLIKERTSPEVALWREYLIFASLIGSAEQVAKELKDIDPVMFEKAYTMPYNDMSRVIRLSNSYSRVLDAHAVTHSYSGGGSLGGFSRSGGGGHSSFGGGGGFSGGGHSGVR